MARRLAHLRIECIACGNQADIDAAVLEARLDQELTLDTVARSLHRFVCRSCQGRSVKVYDDTGRLLADPAKVARCRICGDPILLPRLQALPGTTLCARCAEEASASKPAAPHPQPPAENARCPRCGQATVVRENSQDRSYFLGCTGFPKCRWTEPFEPAGARGT